MNTLEFLSKLRDLGIQIATDGNKLQCNAPKNALTPQLRSELAERKQEIIDLLKNNNLVDSYTSSTIQPVGRDQILPLSFAQQRLWFIDRLEPNKSFYNIPEAIRFKGNLNVDILQQSLDAIVSHHEILRTNYIEADGNPIQIISEPHSVTLKIIDLQQYEKIEQEVEVQQILKEESQYAFNLTSDLMIRACLLQLSSSEQILLIVKHHIASDGWSIGIMWDQLTQLYLAFVEGKSSPLPTLSVQYADYAVWQRKWLADELLEKQLNYWKKQLVNANPLLELPTNFPRPLVQTYCGATQSHALSSSLSRKINQLCQQEGATLYMGLLAAFQILLHRYTQQEDILVGSVIAGRNRKEIEGLIGFFVNTLVLRADLSGNPSFKELLSQVRATTLDAYEHQDLPFEKLVEVVNPERSSSYSPIFQVMFDLQNTHSQRKELLGLVTQSVEVEIETSKFDLELSVEERDNVIITSWTYNTDLFEQTTIERMYGHFQILLESIVGNPQQLISQLPMLTETEKQQLLTEWNQTQVEYPQHKCIHQLFEEQVERTPDAIAVSFKDQQLTYQELNNRANQLAHYLKSLGVEPNVLVGICVERSLEMIVGLLGILKVGGAYVPLDPNYPPERLEYMIADAKMPVLLTQSKWKIPEHQSQIIRLDADWEKIASQNSDNLAPIGENKHVAYVIYTSGSTGNPKGVMISQQALVSFVQTAISEYGISGSDRVLQFASINFDAAVEEIYPSLCTGATLVLRTDKMLSDLPTFFQACEDLQLTVLDLPTAYWHQLAAELANTSTSLPEFLRLVIIGGEKVLLEPVRDWQKYVTKSGKADRLQLINTYGPTETTVVATLYRIPNTFLNINEVPIGRPLAHLQTYILDPQLQPVPIGVTGEIHIGGDSLAIGYLNRPELTDEKFIPNPFSSQSGSRLYKTGDLARYLSDGDIEYLGRIDNQVKIRGFRIELGEIETVLSQHPNIRATVVTVREDIPSDKRVVAYVVAEDKSQNIDLRAFLKERLPSYMIPSAFVFLEAMPITPNGKIDYRSLPVPDISSTQLEKNFVPPSNPTQETLAKIWSQILGVERVGINDNFFELGGHSLLSVRLISEIEKAFNYQIPLSSLFKISTISEIEELIGSQTQEITFDEESSLGLNLDDYRALISHSAGKTGLRLGKRGLIISTLPESPSKSKPFVWIGEARTSKKLKLTRPVYVMPGASLSISMNSHDDYISTISALLVDELLSAQPSGSYSLGGWCYNGLVALEMAQQLRNMGKQVDLVSLIDASGKSKLFKFAHKVNSSVGTLRFHLSQIFKLSFKDKWHYIKARVKNSQSDPDNLNAKTKKEEFKFDQEAVDVLGKASDDYSPRHYSGRILLIVGTEQVVHGQKDIKHFDLSWLFPNFGWGNLFHGKVHLAKIKCDHLELMEEPWCEEIGQIIQTIENLV